MGTRGRRWSVASAGLQAGLSAITSPPINRLPSSWPNSPVDQDTVFDTRNQVLIWPKEKNRSNSIGELFSGSWIKNNSSSEETLRFKAPRFSFSLFQVSSKNNQKSGLSVVTLVNGNTILIYSQYGSELNNALFKAKTDLKISNYCFISASFQTIQMLDSSRGVIGSTLERIIEQDFDDKETYDEQAKKEIWLELLRNETVYQKSLKNLHTIYAEPIRKSSYLEAEEHQKIFFGIETLISLNLELISQLESTLSNWETCNSNTGSIFSSEIWRHYNEYYWKYPEIKNMLQQKLQEECSFTEFCQKNQLCTGLSVEDLLFLPFYSVSNEWKKQIKKTNKMTQEEKLQPTMKFLLSTENMYGSLTSQGHKWKSSSLNDLSKKKHYAPIAPSVLSNDTSVSICSVYGEEETEQMYRHSDLILTEINKKDPSMYNEKNSHSFLEGLKHYLPKISPKTARKQDQDIKISKTQLVILPVEFYDGCEFEYQRIPEYEQYLSSLLEKTEENQPDYQSIKEAIAQIKKILQGCYEDTDGTEERANKNHFLNSPTQLEKDKISEHVQRRRKSSPGAILFKNLGSAKMKLTRITSDKSLDQDVVNFARYQSNVKRIFIMESAVQLTNAQDRYLFLFDDVLLVAKQKSNNQFKLKYYVRICEMWLATCLDEISEVSHDEEKSFVIGWPTHNKVATFSSKDLKEKWQTRLKQLIDEKKENEKLKEIQLNIQNTDQKQTITMLVQNTSTVKEVVKRCLEQLQISKGEIDDYDLWYTDTDSTLNPLIGHEIPYSIKMNHIRNSSENKDDCDNNETKRKYDFFLMYSKKSPKKQNTDDIDAKAFKKKRHPFHLFKKAAKLEEKPLGKLFGQPLKDIMINNNPPKPIDDLLRLLFQEGPFTNGIFRKPANAKKKRELCEIMDHEETTNMDDVTVNLAASVLMEYLRNIPQGLLIDDKYNDWIHAGKLLGETERMAKIKNLVLDLPPCNRQLLQHLVCILYYINEKSSENLMSSQNLATCIAPSLLGSKQPDSQDDLMLIRDVISYMIENCVQIFGEEVISLFREVSPERHQEDSDTDSFHSTLSTQEPGGLHQSDDSSMHSLDREPVNAERESPNGLSPTSRVAFNSQFEPDLDVSDSPEFKDESINEYENVPVMKTPQKTENQLCRSILASNNLTYPVPPPRKNRQNCLGAKHKSMTSIDKTNQSPMKQENHSQSENYLLILPDYHENVFKSVQMQKKTLNSQIIMTGQVPECSTRNLQQESVGQFDFTKDHSIISHHFDPEDSVERDERKIGCKSYERTRHSKLLDEVAQQNLHAFYEQQQQQQQIRRRNHARLSYTKSVDEINQQNWQPLYQQQQQKQQIGRNNHARISYTKSADELGQQNWQQLYQRQQQQPHEQQTGRKNQARNSPTKSVDELNQQNWQPLYQQQQQKQQHKKHIERKNHARNSHTKFVDELGQQNCQQLYQNQQQQFNDQVLPSEKKHLHIAPQNSNTLINDSKIQNENKIKLALFENNLDPIPAGKSSKETALRIHPDIPRINLILSHPPKVLLKNIGQPVAATKGEQSSKRDNSNAGTNCTKHNEPADGHTSRDKELVESEQVSLSHLRQAYSENNQPTQKSLKSYKEENISPSPHAAATMKIPAKPKHPPSYEEATHQKQRQHKRSTLAENLYNESVKEYCHGLNTYKQHGNISFTEKSISNHLKYDAICDKLYRKNIVNSPSPRKLGQSQHQLNAEKNQIKCTPPVDIALRNRLQGNLSKSDTALNFLCSDTPGIVRKSRSPYPNRRADQYSGFVDKDRTKRFIQKPKEVKLEPEKRHRNATNEKNVCHKPLTKTKSVDFIENEETVDSYKKSKHPVLPWSVSDMINKFASPINETPHSHDSFK